MSEDRFTSYAQNGEDVMLWRALREAGPGFYIDVGAADPDLLSVTRAFYERGWRGLDVEPLPEQAARLREARPRDVVVEAALAEAPGRAAFHRVRKDGDLGLSTLDAEGAARSGGAVDRLEVPLTTLAALCREHVAGEVQFLKIDVEGAEAAVLRGADLQAVRPWIVLVEATRPLSRETSHQEWEPLLLEAGYRFVWFDGLNRFYLAEERHAALAPHFTVPPNPFDEYRVWDPFTEQRLAAAEELARTRLATIAALEAALHPPPALPQPPPRRRAALRLYGLVRPLARPLAWRLRSFLIGPLRDELAALRARQDEIVARLDQCATSSSGPALDASLARALEQVLLTAALDRD